MHLGERGGVYVPSLGVHREDAIDNRVIALTSRCLSVCFAHWCEHMNEGKENDEKCGALLGGGGGGVNDEKDSLAAIFFTSFLSFPLYF